MTARREDRKQKVEQLHELLVESVEAVQSSSDWKRLLDFAGRFHQYSFDNQLLIHVQHDQAYRAGRVNTSQPTYVAGFHTWKANGRSVDKGQRGYAILAPVVGPTLLARSADGTTRPLGRRADIADGEELVRGPISVRGFTVAHVWDVAQTSGSPIPEPPRPRLLEGGAPEGLAEQLRRFVYSLGFTVIDVCDADAIGGANGVTDFAACTVKVRADMDPAARVKTLAHETGHVLLHDPSDGGEVTTIGVAHRGRAEVEAESVAYVVTSVCGMDPAGYSLPYVASWAGTERPADVVRSTARRVVDAAHQVLDSLEPAPSPAAELAGVTRTIGSRAAPQRAHSRHPARASEAIGL